MEVAFTPSAPPVQRKFTHPSPPVHRMGRAPAVGTNGMGRTPAADTPSLRAPFGGTERRVAPPRFRVA